MNGFNQPHYNTVCVWKERNKKNIDRKLVMCHVDFLTWFDVISEIGTSIDRF